MTENQKLQQVILSIAKEIRRICEKNNIRYFIGAGSHLGAVRHSGFIPWDDDFDFVMRREEYEKFLAACKKDLNTDKYFLQNEFTEPNYCFAFTKIQLKGTEIIEDFSKNVDISHGIFVDIFPYDNLPDNEQESKKLLRKNHVLKNLMWVKCGYGTKKHKKKLSYWIFKICSVFITKDKIRKKREKLITKYNDSETKYCFLSDYPNDIQLVSLFDKTAVYRFEDTSFDGFADYDTYLSALYGDDYMTLPPEDKRVVHSDYKVNYGDFFANE